MFFLGCFVVSPTMLASWVGGQGDSFELQEACHITQIPVQSRLTLMFNGKL